MLNYTEIKYLNQRDFPTKISSFAEKLNIERNTLICKFSRFLKHKNSPQFQYSLVALFFNFFFSTGRRNIVRLILVVILMKNALLKEKYILRASYSSLFLHIYVLRCTMKHWSFQFSATLLNIKESYGSFIISPLRAVFQGTYIFSHN